MDIQTLITLKISLISLRIASARHGIYIQATHEISNIKTVF